MNRLANLTSSPLMVTIRRVGIRMEKCTCSIMRQDDCCILYLVYMLLHDVRIHADSLEGLVKAVRSVTFSPGVKLLAAAGDARVIALYSVVSGQQVANLTGHGAWIFSLDWNDTGEYLLSGYVIPQANLFISL
jgi:WD40 repeat protein